MEHQISKLGILIYSLPNSEEIVGEIDTRKNAGY